MQLLLPVLLVTNFLGLASACTQWHIQYKSKVNACETEAGEYRNLCYELPQKYYDYDGQHQDRLGTASGSLVASAFCDTCGRGARCYCLIDFWRYKEWMEGGIPEFPDKTWVVDKDVPAGPFSDETVHC